MTRFNIKKSEYDAYKKKQEKKEKINKFFLLHLGLLLLAAGVYFFKIPNGFSTGGVSGLGTVLGKITPLSPGQLIMILNVIYLVLGFIFLGKSTGVLTVYCSLAFSALIRLFEIVYPVNAPFTDEKMLELVYAIMLTGIGSAMLFYCDASSGGTDIAALIIKKYTRLNSGKALLVSDFFIAMASFYVFDFKTGLFSLLGLFSKAFLVDNIIDSFNACKYFIVITSKPEDIAAYIIKEMHHGVTMSDAVGAYTAEDKKMLHTVCTRLEAIRLRQFVKKTDLNAFVIITSSSDIIGRGFRSV